MPKVTGNPVSLTFDLRFWKSHFLRSSLVMYDLEILLRYPHSFHWRHNDRGGVSDHQPCDCLLSCSFRRRSKKTLKLRVTGLCAGNSPHKGPVTRKMFPFDDVIMRYWPWKSQNLLPEPPFHQHGDREQSGKPCYNVTDYVNVVKTVSLTVAL